MVKKLKLDPKKKKLFLLENIRERPGHLSVLK